MDRNVPDYYVETTKKSLRHTERWLSRVDGRYENTMPILTPRFTPTCTRELMDGLGDLAARYGLPVQSHLNENPREVEWVRELEPDSASYSDTYLRSGLFGGDVPTVMAHCIYNSEEEIALIRDRGVYVAHCPQSNLNIASGIAPVRRFLDEGIHVGLGTDVSGGHSASIFETMKAAIQSSKMYWRYVDSTKKPLTFPEAFYLGTLGGGHFFGRCGTFREGYEFDAVILEDSNLYTMRDLTPAERLERIVYLSDDRNVTGKFVRGEKLY
jgi:guanine deaminase